MIDYLDLLLHRLLRNRVAALATDAQVRFQPPDDAWRTFVATLNGVALNVYLTDLRENRRLRDNTRTRTTTGFDVFETPPPRRVDCHYLLSAWSPASVTPVFDPTPDEHALLAEAARVLGEHDELDPAAIYAASTPPAAPPAAIAEDRFPITLLPTEGFLKLGEFWATMGDAHRWKPCLYAVVTVPLREPARRAGAMVTTAMVDSRVTGEATTSETLMQFGGTVRASGAVNAPLVPDAWVDLRDAAGHRRQLVKTDVDGRFLFVQVAAGTYQLHVHAVGFASIAQAIEVPAPGGSYDLHF